MAALTRPALEYLFLVSAAVEFVLACWPRRAAPVTCRRSLGLALSCGYASEVLVQRIALDQMNWSEFGKSFVCWSPDGNGMGSLLWGQGGCARFQLDPRPDTFYWIGNTALMDSTIAAAGGLAHHFSYLMHTFILPQLPWHLPVSIPLAMRGILINHYWSFVLTLVCVAMIWLALRDGDRRLLIVALPGWFMLTFHALCAVNQVRYNLMLVVPFALAGGLMLDHAWARWACAPASDGELQVYRS